MFCYWLCHSNNVCFLKTYLSNRRIWSQKSRINLSCNKNAWNRVVKTISHRCKHVLSAWTASCNSYAWTSRDFCITFSSKAASLFMHHSYILSFISASKSINNISVCCTIYNKHFIDSFISKEVNYIICYFHLIKNYASEFFPGQFHTSTVRPP